MADEIKTTSLMAMIRHERDRYDRDYGRSMYEGDFRRGRRPDKGELMEYAMKVLMNNADLAQRHDAKAAMIGEYARSAEAHYAMEAADMTNRIFRSESIMRGELNDAKYDAAQLRKIVGGLELAPTVVRVAWSQEADDWCSKIKTPFQMVRDGGQALYCFSNMKTAAMFKLLFA